jgi:hypothetical protein
MKNIYIGALSLFVAIFIASAVTPPIPTSKVEKPIERFTPVEAVTPPPVVKLAEPKLKITDAQTVWIHALEWCESSGKPTAVNPIDRDGTPSYGAFQFKPSTFWHFANKYDVGITMVSDAHLDRDNQYEVVAAMVEHRKEIEWHNQFPGCVAKLGLPPSY